MPDDEYRTAIKTALKENGLSANHSVHLGRSVGTVAGEVAGLSPEELRTLGNWSVSVLEARYSSKLPMSTMVMYFRYLL